MEVIGLKRCGMKMGSWILTWIRDYEYEVLKTVLDQLGNWRLSHTVVLRGAEAPATLSNYS